MFRCASAEKNTGPHWCNLDVKRTVGIQKCLCYGEEIDTFIVSDTTLDDRPTVIISYF